MSNPTPQVGDGATLIYYTDRAAATVIAVSPTGSKVTVQEDRAIRTDKNGMSDQQTYRYERDPAGRVHVFHRNGRGGYGGRGRGVRLSIGARNSYHDYTF